MANFRRMLPANIREATKYYCSVVRRYSTVDSSTELQMRKLDVLARAIEAMREKGDEEKEEILARGWLVRVGCLLDKAK